MKRILATLTGVTLATGIALAATGDRPEDLVTRYYASTGEAGMAASWNDWHPEATHSITLKWGMGQPDDHFSYAMADWETLPDWQNDPEMVETLKGYIETHRSAPSITSEPVDEATTLVTAVARVDYTWFGHDGQTTQIDRFHVTAYLGALAIRSLDTTYDYR